MLQAISWCIHSFHSVFERVLRARHCGHMPAGAKQSGWPFPHVAARVYLCEPLSLLEPPLLHISICPQGYSPDWKMKMIILTFSLFVWNSPSNSNNPSPQLPPLANRKQGSYRQRWSWDLGSSFKDLSFLANQTWPSLVCLPKSSPEHLSIILGLLSKEKTFNCPIFCDPRAIKDPDAPEMWVSHTHFIAPILLWGENQVLELGSTPMGSQGPLVKQELLH